MCATVSLMGHTYVYQESNIKLNIFDLLLLNYIIYKRVCVRVCACVCACVCVSSTSCSHHHALIVLA